MEVKYRVERNGLYIDLYGELDEFSAGYCRSKTDEIIDRAVGLKNVVFDFSGVTFMDSTGIGVLLGRYKRLKKMGVPVFIQSPSLSVNKILQISGLYEIMPKI